MKKVVLPPDATEEERARASREWQAQRDAKYRTRRERRAERAAAQTQAAIDAGLVVKQLPPGPRWQRKRKNRKEVSKAELGRLREQVHNLEAQVGMLKAASGRTGFYHSPDWHRIRYEALKRSNGCCELCGASKKDGAVMQVDHIKPRSRFPHLALTLSNLQVLCRPCNMGKGNRDVIDWRKSQS